MSDVARREVLESLPIREDGFTIRHWNRKDLDLLAAWPSYPFPFKAFDFSFRNISADERDRLFHLREARADTLILVVDHELQRVIGYFSLREIDWNAKVIRNIGIRIEPTWRNKGVGTQTLSMIVRRCFDCGIKEMRLDVAASNGGAIRSYEKVGFVRSGVFWRDAEDLKGETLDQPRFDFLRPHVRMEGGTPQIRFIQMELHARAYNSHYK